LIRDDTRIVLFPEVSVLPLFLIDAAIFFSGADAGAKELLIRSGRPVIDFTTEPFNPELLYTDYLTRLQALPRTNYQPIDCNFYDNFEAAIVTHRVVDLIYLDPFGEEVIEATKLKDLKTKLTEEFVQLESKEWLRVDRIASVDGEAAGASCSF
jgi:Rho-binding antiterminator